MHVYFLPDNAAWHNHCFYYKLQEIVVVSFQYILRLGINYVS